MKEAARTRLQNQIKDWPASEVKHEFIKSVPVMGCDCYEITLKSTVIIRKKGLAVQVNDGFWGYENIVFDQESLNKAPYGGFYVVEPDTEVDYQGRFEFKYNKFTERWDIVRWYKKISTNKSLADAGTKNSLQDFFEEPEVAFFEAEIWNEPDTLPQRYLIGNWENIKDGVNEKIYISKNGFVYSYPAGGYKIVGTNIESYNMYKDYRFVGVNKNDGTEKEITLKGVTFSDENTFTVPGVGTYKRVEVEK